METMRWVMIGVLVAGALAQLVAGGVIAGRVRQRDPGFDVGAGPGRLLRAVLHYDALCRERGEATNAMVIAYWAGLGAFVLGALLGILAAL